MKFLFGVAAAVMFASACSPSAQRPTATAEKDAAYFARLFEASWELADREPADAVEGTVVFLLEEYVNAFGDTSYDRQAGVVVFERGGEAACVEVFGPEGADRDAWTEPVACP